MVEKAELVHITFPLTGHLPAAIEFAKRVTEFDHRISRITILAMKLPMVSLADAYTKSLATSLPCVQLIGLPEIEDPPPMELLKRCAEAYAYSLVDKSKPLVRKTIGGMLSSQGSDSFRVIGLILDLFCANLTDIGDELGLPSYIFLPTSAGFLGLMQYLPKRYISVSSEFDENSCDEELSIPGFVNPIPTKALLHSLFCKDGYDTYARLGERFVGAKGILLDTFAELEPYALDYFARGSNYPPVYSIGPVINLKVKPNPDLDPARDEEIIKWLDEQHESSVVYVCFGSISRLRASQARELAQGLELSGYKFLWCLRLLPPENQGPADDPLPEGFLDRLADRGMVCKWAPQVEVLAHKAVGGFVSHCGWNSILESLWFGVPIATWPMHSEQQLNAITLVRELGLALEMRLYYRALSGELVMAEEIARTIGFLMESDNTVRKKVKEMSESARKAVMDGGSSFVVLERLINDMVGSST